MYIYDIPHYYPKFNVLTVLKSQGSVNFPACLWHLVLTYHTNIYHFTKQNIQGLQRSAGPGYEMLWAEIDAVRNRFFSSKILRLLHKYKKHHEVPKHSETTPNQTQLSERICPNHQIAPYYKKNIFPGWYRWYSDIFQASSMDFTVCMQLAVNLRHSPRRSAHPK